MSAKSHIHSGFPAVALWGGAVAAAALLLSPAPVSAHEAGTLPQQAISRAVHGSVPVLNGTLGVLAEQHSRGGGGGGGHAVPRGGSGGGGGPRSGGSSGGSSSGDSGGGARTRSSGGDNSGNDGSSSGGTPTYSRPRGDRPATGTAVERRGNGGGPVIVGGGGYWGGLYPWGWGGLGLGGYYGYYDPWGWYDPYPPGAAYGYDYDGGLKLKVKPRQAEVYVDGYFAGAVDDFDGVFQKLRLNPGPHRIEIRLDGYEPLSFEIRIQPDRTVTYKGELKKTDRGD